MNDEQYQELKSIIHKAVPGILELKFGCEVEVLFDDSDFYGKVKPEWIRRPIYKVSEKKAVVYIVDPPFPNNAIDVSDKNLKEEFRILGRPIRLSDVLYAISKGSRFPMMHQEDFVAKFWNLLDDNLDHQSEECKQFLYDLLKGAKND